MTELPEPPDRHLWHDVENGFDRKAVALFASLSGVGWSLIAIWVVNCPLSSNWRLQAPCAWDPAFNGLIFGFLFAMLALLIYRWLVTGFTFDRESIWIRYTLGRAELIPFDQVEALDVRSHNNLVRIKVAGRPRKMQWVWIHPRIGKDAAEISRAFEQRTSRKATVDAEP